MKHLLFTLLISVALVIEACALEDQRMGNGKTKPEAYGDAATHAPKGAGWHIKSVTYYSGVNWQCLIVWEK